MTKRTIFLTTMMAIIQVLVFAPIIETHAFSASSPPKTTTQRQSEQLRLTRSILLHLASSDPEPDTEDKSSILTTTTTSASSEEEVEEALLKNLTKQQKILLDSGLITLSDLDPTNTNSKLTKSKSATQQKKLQLQKERKFNIFIAILSFAAAISNYLNQYLHPVTAVQLLSQMTAESAPLTSIGRNGKPTLVDFWAPWCENCRAAAPTLREIEKEYASKVNFVVVNGDDGSNGALTWELIGRFNVDAIPHLALLDEEGTVQTTLIGPVSRSVLRADIDTLLQNAALVVGGGEGDDVSSSSSMTLAEERGEDAVIQQQQQQKEGNKRKELPYKMYDAFRGRPDSDRTIRFE